MQLESRGRNYCSGTKVETLMSDVNIAGNDAVAGEKGVGAGIEAMKIDEEDW